MADVMSPQMVPRRHGAAGVDACMIERLGEQEGEWGEFVLTVGGEVCKITNEYEY